MQVFPPAVLRGDLRLMLLRLGEARLRFGGRSARLGAFLLHQRRVI